MNISYKGFVRVSKKTLVLMVGFALLSTGFAFFPATSLHAATVLSDGFGTGNDDVDIDDWNEEGTDSDSSTLAKKPTNSGEDIASPDGGRFAKIGFDEGNSHSSGDDRGEWICRQINSAGYYNLALKYYWNGDSDTENNTDYGIVEYRATSNGNTDQTCNSSSSSWTQLASHDLFDDTNWSPLQTINLPDALDNDSSWFIRFRNDASADDEYFRVDGVLIEGTPPDTTGPEVTIDEAAGQDDPTLSTATSVNFEVEFNEAVTGFDASDVTLGGTAGATTKSVTGGPTSYNVEVGGWSSHGTITISVPAAAAKDASNNDSGTPTVIDDTVTVNAKPVANAQGPIAVGWHGTVNFTLTGTDADNAPVSPLTFSAGDPSYGSLTCDASGSCTFTHNTSSYGDDNFTFRVFDGLEYSELATVTLDISGPEDEDPEPDPDPENSCVIVSDEITQENGENAELVSFIHERWTALISAASWIWGEDPVSLGEGDEVETFTRTFSLTTEPTGATLLVAADNTYSVEINDTPVCLDADTSDGPEGNYNYQSGGQDTCVIDPGILVAGENTIEFVVTNKNVGGETPTTNPAGLLYKLTVDEAQCGEPVTDATLIATKIVCDSEEYLPNWGEGGANITETTAQDFLNEVNDGHEVPVCHLEPNWQFEWVQVSDSNENPGDNSGTAGAPWTLFGPTAGDGTITTSIPAGELVWVREVMKPFYAPFSGWLSGGEDSVDDVSAEMYCSTDVLNYDNWDWINPVEAGETYYCVAFNAETDETPEQCTPGEKWADEVVTSAQGLKKSGNAVDLGRSNPDSVLGADDNVFFSLGFGGSITVSFETYIENGIGDDLVVYETTNGSYPLETVQVEVSQNGSYWETLSEEAVNTAGGETGLDIDETSFSWIRYVRLTDTSEPALFNSDADGFDVDAIKGVYGVCEEPKPEDDDSGEPTTSSETIVVSDDTSLGENQPGWLFNRDPGTQTPYIFSDAAASIGNGSLEVYPITNSVNGNSDKFIGELFLLTPIAGVEEITYDFQISAPDNTVEEQFYMNVYANFGESSPTKFYDCRYNIVPTIGSTGVFTTVTFDPTQSYPVTTRTGGDASPYTCPSVPADMDTLSPGSTLRVVALNVGDTSASDLGVGGYLDKVVTEITTGLNTHTTTYDFEPVGEGTLIIKKLTSYYENGEFDFDIGGNESFYDADILVNNGTGETSLVLPTGTYSLTETQQEDWEFTSVDCEYEGESEGTDIAYGKQITIHDGETVTCTFHNAYDEDSGGSSGNQAGNNGPSVLGASTVISEEQSCGPLLNTYLRLGGNNDTDEVAKLQDFLNGEMGSGLPLTGVFGPATDAAVRAFQIKYWEEVLKPWFGIEGSAIQDEDDSTGYVYKTTRWKINNLWCPGSEALPAIP